MTDQSIEDASRREFDDFYDNKFKHIGNSFVSSADIKENYWELWQAARQSISQSVDDKAYQSEPVAKNETIATALISKLKRMPMSNAITPQLELDIRKILLAFKPIYLAAPQQAAAPIDNVAEALEKAAQVCDKVNDTYRWAINNANPRTAESIQQWREGVCDGSIQCAKAIRALIPTQAAPIESGK
jgi:hypothetical protein